MAYPCDTTPGPSAVAAIMRHVVITHTAWRCLSIRSTVARRKVSGRPSKANQHSHSEWTAQRGPVMGVVARYRVEPSISGLAHEFGRPARERPDGRVNIRNGDTLAIMRARVPVLVAVRSCPRQRAWRPLLSEKSASWLGGRMGKP